MGRHIILRRKKCNLDGLVGWNCYWHDLMKQPLTFFSRRQGSKSLTVWERLALIAKLSWNFSMENKIQQGIKRQQHLPPFDDILCGRE